MREEIKSDIPGKDAYFMMLTVHKNGSHKDFLACVFSKKGPIFEALMNRFVKLTAIFSTILSLIT